MSHLFNSLPYPLILTIFAGGVIVTIYAILRFHTYLGFLGSSALIMLCVISGFFGVVLKTIEIFHVFINFENTTFFLLGISLVIGLALLMIKVYLEFFSRYPKYKKWFWIYIAAMILLVAFAVLCITMANLSR